MARETVRHAYDHDLISLLERTLFNLDEDGELHAYEVLLDSIPVVTRNTNPGRFREFEEFVNLDRQFKLVVKIFYGPTDCQRFEYSHRPEGMTLAESERGLGGLGSVAEQIAVERLRWDHERLQKTEEEQRRTIEEQKAEIKTLIEQKGELEKEAEELRNRKLVMGNINLAELGSVIVEGMIRRNTHLLARHPLTKGLAGIIDQDNENGEARLTSGEQGAMSEEDEAYLDLLRKIQEAFSPQDFMRVLGLLDRFIADPSLIGPVEDLLSEQTTQENQI